MPSWNTKSQPALTQSPAGSTSPANPSYANTNANAQFLSFISPTDITPSGGAGEVFAQDYSESCDGNPTLSATAGSGSTGAGAYTAQLYKQFTANGKTGTAITLDLTDPAMKSVSFYWNFPKTYRDQAPSGSWDLHIGSDTSMTNLANRRTASLSFGPMFEGWNVNSQHIDSFTTVGAPVMNTMRKASLRLNTSLPGSVHMGMLAVGFRIKPKIVLMMDDGYEEQHSRANLPSTAEGRPGGFFTYLKSKGMKGVVGVIAPFVERDKVVGGVNILTKAQLQEMYDAGFDLAVHGEYGMTDWTSLSATRRDLAANQTFLKKNGWHRAANLFVLPLGAITQNARDAMRSLGFVAARALVGANISTAVTQPVAPFVHDILQLNAVTMGNATAVTMKGYVDQAVALGQTLFLYGHQFTLGSGASGNNLYTAYNEFTQTVDYIAQQRDAGLLDVVTYSDWYTGVTGVRPY